MKVMKGLSSVSSSPHRTIEKIGILYAPSQNIYEPVANSTPFSIGVVVMKEFWDLHARDCQETFVVSREVTNKSEQETRKFGSDLF